MTAYIDEELSHGTLLGPFDNKTLQLHIFPFMTSEMQDSELKQTIVDLSCPNGQSVNAGVSKDVYFGSKFILNYSLVDILQRLIQWGPGSMLFKIDITPVFCQLKVDSVDIDLFNFQSVPFGYRHGSSLRK